MRSRFGRALAGVCIAGLAACSGGISPDLEVSPTEGIAPLRVTLDASGTVAPDGVELTYRFDFDGDGELDTEPLSDPVFERDYEVAGTFRATVEVSAVDGVVVRAEAPVDIVVTRAPIDLDADVDRDGEITDDDKNLEGEWSSLRGAVYWSNLDDDDGDGLRDAADNELDGEADLEDFTQLLLHEVPDLEDGERVFLRVEPEAASRRVRIFLQEGAGLTPILFPGDPEVQLDRAVGEVEHTIWLEGLNARAAGFDGITDVVVERRAGSEVVASDRVRLRGAPILFPDNTQPAERLYVMPLNDPRSSPNQPFISRLQSDLPDDITLYFANENTYFADRWVQDSMQTGYQMLPGPNGETRLMITYLQTERISGYGLENLIPDELLGTDFGFTYPGGQASSLNYGGNLEVAPPHVANDQRFPYGRLLVGGGAAGTLSGRANTDFMTPPQKNHLEGQGLQAPAMELSTEWLAVGHLDEIFLFVPDHERGGAKPWRVVIASPDLARGVLENLAERGEGAATVFQGRRSQTTVQRILDDAQLMAFNDAAQARIDSIRDILADEMDLLDDDFVEVPVLYEQVGFGGLDFAAAYNPGVQNLVVANDHLFIPDPEGPRSSGEDAWQRTIRDALEPMGNTVHFVDVFESYHELLGEAHCGTNFQRSPFERPWWEVQ
jgi:protein-arginine deiminase